MIILVGFAFIAGLVTILSPCILPILPIVLSGSVGSGKRKPLGIVTGFISSFTIFTLFLSSLVGWLGISADSLRFFAVLVVFGFGVSMLLPQTQIFLEKIFSKLSGVIPHKAGAKGFWGGMFIGVSLGLVWTPCVGPILASVISLAITGTVSANAFFITFAYSLGTAIPMLAIIWGGNKIMQKVPLLTKYSKKIQQIFGVLMIITALAIYFKWDRQFQTYVLETFPEYGIGLTSIEDNEIVKEQLDELRNVDEENDLDLESNLDKGNYPSAPELIAGGNWFNSKPLTLSDLKGKVVLVDFWTYTCINCIRTLPYLRNWHEKYSDDGLVIIGVHSPEFEFEKSSENLASAIDDHELMYPIMQDNNFKTWRAYNNRFWPAKYLIDKDGLIRYTHFGEGKYDETELMIQKLLNESGVEINQEIENPEYGLSQRTPELYLGYNRIENFSAIDDIDKDTFESYSHPDILKDNQFSFDGDWMIANEFSISKPGATLRLNFTGQEVYLVMRPEMEVKVNEVSVFLDGEVVSMDMAGSDVNNGVVSVDQDRLYKLIRLNDPGSHILELKFIGGDIEIFAFTFG